MSSPDERGGRGPASSQPGDKVDVLIERGGDQKTVSVTLGTRPTTNG